MPMYNVAVAALAIGASRKWTDNVLSQHELPDVVSVRQGVARRISYAALLRLAVIRQLHAQLGIGVSNAVQFAGALLESGQAGVLETGQISVRVDLRALRRTLDEGLAAALESTPARRRGRPPRKAQT